MAKSKASQQEKQKSESASTGNEGEQQTLATQVQGVAEPGNETTEVVTTPNAPNLSNAAANDEDGAEKCWNCAVQGVKKVPKLVNGICKDCGFDISKIHNLDLLAKQRMNRSQDGKPS